MLLAVALAGVLAVGGTAAYLTDRSAEVENAFAPSEVTCSVAEGFEAGSTVKENVKIQNTGDTAAFIRAAIVVNWVDSQGNIGSDKPVVGTDYGITLETDPDDSWTLVGDYYYFEKPVAKGSFTDILIARCEPISVKEGYTLQVEVLASAIQSEPVAAVQEAWKVSIAGGVVSTVSGS